MIRDQIDQAMAIMEAAFDPAFGEAWNRRQLEDALLMPNTHLVMSETPIGGDDPNPAGFMLSRSVLDEEELLLIAVHPDARRKGIGKALVQRLFTDAATRQVKRVFLEMRDGNPAETLYRSLGFSPIGRRRGYYRSNRLSPIDAITFSRELA